MCGRPGCPAGAFPDRDRGPHSRLHRGTPRRQIFAGRSALDRKRGRVERTALSGPRTGRLPLVVGLLRSVARGEFGADLLAGISIVTSILLGEYLAGTLVVLMLSGGQALEAYAVRKASAVLAALAGRMPAVAHRKDGGTVADVSLDAVTVGDALVVFPHEVCPADGTVLDGHGSMNEAYLTGEPYEVSKTPGGPSCLGQ